MRAMFEDPTNGIYYLVRDDHEIIGCHIITCEWSDWRNSMVLCLQSVQKGILKMMFDNLINIIKNDPQLIGLRLDVDKSNSCVMKIYQAMGMDGSHYTVFEWIK